MKGKTEYIPNSIAIDLIKNEFKKDYFEEFDLDFSE